MKGRKSRYLSSLWLLAGVALSLLIEAPSLRAQETIEQEPGWSTPANLSNTDRPSVLPDVAADSAGNVYVVWGENLTDENRRCELLMFSKWDGQRWSAPTDIHYGVGWLPRIGVDSHGKVHLIWRGPGGILYSWAWGQGDPNNPRSWSEPVVLANLSQGQAGDVPYWPDMVVDAQDRIHVIWTDVDIGEERYNSSGLSAEETHCLSGCVSAWYARSLDQGRTWSSPVKIVREGTANIPVLTVDKHGNPYVVWRYIDWAGKVGMSYSQDGGATWTDNYWVTEDPRVTAVGIAVTGAGMIVVAWNPGPFVSISQDDGISWSEPQFLPVLTGTQRSGGGQLDLVVDSADVVHLFGGSHWTWDGGDWQAAVLPSQDPCSVGAYSPKTDVSQGNVIHLVTHQRLECRLGWAGAMGRGDVFYTRYESDAPHTGVISLPSIPTAQPTPTPSPTLVPVDPTGEPTATVPSASSGWGPDVTNTQGSGLGSLVSSSPLLGIVLAGATMVVVVIWKVVVGRRQ